MKIPFVDLHAQYLNLKPEIDAAIADVIANTSFVRGPQVDKFEKDWADTVGMKHCISCANGADAIYISMKALGMFTSSAGCKQDWARILHTPMYVSSTIVLPLLGLRNIAFSPRWCK